FVIARRDYILGRGVHRALADRSIRIERSVELDRHSTIIQPVLSFLAVTRIFPPRAIPDAHGRPIAASAALTELTASTPVANRDGSGVRTMRRRKRQLQD